MNAKRLACALALLGTACTDKVGDFGLDLAGPRVLAVSPAAGTSGVDFSEPVVVSFSEPVDLATVAASFMVVAEGGEILPGTLELEGLDATYTPSARWDYLSAYSVSVSAGLRDLAGNSLESDFSSVFLTRDLHWIATSAVSTTTDNSAYSSGPVIDVVEGNAFVVWDSIYPWVSRRESNGTWGTPFKVSDPAGGMSDDTTVAILGSNAMVIWAQQNAGLTSVDVLGRTFSGTDLSPIEAIDNTTAAAGSPALASDGDASAIAVMVYFETPSSARHAEFDTDVGWVTPGSLQPFNNTDAEFPDVAMSSGGRAFAVWMQESGAEMNVLASHRPQGGNFAPPTTLDIVTSYPSHPKVVARGELGALAVWKQDVGGSPDLFASRFDGAAWESAMVLSSASQAFCVTANDMGDALLVYETSSGYRSAHFR